jgi:hypothetical protein
LDGNNRIFGNPSYNGSSNSKASTEKNKSAVGSVTNNN